MVKTAADLIERNLYDLILLDVMIPIFSGFDLMEYIRPMGIPVIFLTAKRDVQDKVKGLKLGAEDYIVKPFEMVELVARIDVVLRRYHKGRDCIEIDNVVINVEAREVTKQGKHINLTIKEFDLLVLLAQNKNIALFRETPFCTGLGRRFLWRNENARFSYPAPAEKIRLGKPDQNGL